MQQLPKTEKKSPLRISDSVSGFAMPGSIRAASGRVDTRRALAADTGACLGSTDLYSSGLDSSSIAVCLGLGLSCSLSSSATPALEPATVFQSKFDRATLVVS